MEPPRAFAPGRAVPGDLLDEIKKLKANVDGLIGRDALGNVFRDFGWSDSDISTLLAHSETTVDGLVTLAEFVSWLEDAFPAGARKAGPYIVAICGASCSGKSTIASKLASELNGKHATRVIAADDFFLFDQYCTDNCPTKEVDGHVWKDWESSRSIDWQGLAQAVRKAAQERPCPPYIIVEGFLLLAAPESSALFDAAVMVELSKEECWRRRGARAECMAHLPPGFSTTEEERNYEVLETYVRSDADHASLLAEAAQRYPDEGSLAWLRWYFEDVIWATAMEQQAKSASFAHDGLPVARLDADTPSGKELWLQTRLPEAVVFLSQALA